MKLTKVYIDVETTGLNPKLHGIHQIAGIIEVNDIVIEEFDLKVKPHPKAQYDQQALDTCKVTEEELQAYPEMAFVYTTLIKMLGKYIDRYNHKDKAFAVGYNNRAFDDIFLRTWFEQNSDTFIISWFRANTLDCLVLATEYLLARRVSMSSFKLQRVAKELGILIDEDKLHNAYYDVYLTREIYRIVTNREIEI